MPLTPPAVLMLRDAACQACATPCALRDAHADPCQFCPLEQPRWIDWDCGSHRRATLGDRLHAIAQPIAVAIDSRLGTDLANCAGCAEARRAFNGGGALPGEKPPVII